MDTMLIIKTIKQFNDKLEAIRQDVVTIKTVVLEMRENK